jgi:hypothetical protein
MQYAEQEYHIRTAENIKNKTYSLLLHHLVIILLENTCKQLQVHIWKNAVPKKSTFKNTKCVKSK